MFSNDDQNASRSQRLGCVLARYLQAIESGQVVDHDLIVAQNPEFARELTPFFRHREALERISPPTKDEVADAPTISRIDGTHGTTHVCPQSRYFGDYELLDEIARGGMGVVYRARQLSLNRTVALKMILSGQLASAEDVRRFRQEAKAVANLDHPHIVPIYEVGEHQGQHYFSMKLVEGSNLSQRLRDGPAALPLPDAVRLMITVARAVHHAHQRGVLHRDLKPGNILLDADGHPFVTDFGLAKVHATDGLHTETGLILGTPSYMPPEQASGHSHEMSPQSDVYSLGAIFYELLTGRPAFQEDNQLNTLLQVLEGEPTLPTRINPHVTRDLERITLKCMAKKPADRYSSAAALADDLDRYLQGEPVEAQGANGWQLCRRWARRQPALVAHLAGLIPVMLILQVKFMLSGTNLPYHLQVMSIFGTWAVAVVLFQWLLGFKSLAAWARYGWATADVGFLTAGLHLADRPLGPLLIGYSLVVVGAGMWFNERLVALTTTLVIASYVILMGMRPEEAGPPQYSFIFAACLAIIGLTVGYQVRRLRALSRYFEQQRLL